MGPQSILSLLLLASGVLAAPPQLPLDCHRLPGDREWPSRRDWARLNATVHGRLIGGQPLGQVCYGEDADEAACADIQARWSFPSLYFPDPVNVMSPYWLNNTCSPFLADTEDCTQGNLASYAINVTDAEDIAAGLKFAQKHNIRVQAKNTGHDYLGRSTGQGSLALWTHNLKGIEFLNYTSPGYTGAAVKLGAGIQAFEAYAAAEENGLRIVGGYCPTVGIAGGYIQGGGHGPLLGTYGLAADNTLEFEVVTVDGKHLVVSPTKHSDLFWALNGGGAGNYAIIVSHTTKAHRDGKVAGASLSLEHNGDDEKFWSVVEAWHRQLLVLDTIPGVTTVYRVTNSSFGLSQGTFTGHSAADLQSVLDPFLEEVRKLGFNYTYEVNEKPSYGGHLAAYTPNPPYGSYLNNETIGGRLVPRQAVKDDAKSVVQLIRDIVSSPAGPSVNGVAGNVSHSRTGTKPGFNAVHPAWRDALYHLIIEGWFNEVGPVDVWQQVQEDMNTYQGILRDGLPAGGVYINEGTFDNPAWKSDYFGVNYERLLKIKKRYDPRFVLYGPAAVGSDIWTKQADGRLCKKK
jgi:FAD/FMN-containing dehydrogenase